MYAAACRQKAKHENPDIRNYRRRPGKQVKQMAHIDVSEADRIRQMAERLDCMPEEDFRLLAGATAGTVEAWRKRGQGPAYIRLGNRYFYPFNAVAEYMESVKRQRIHRGAALL